MKFKTLLIVVLALCLTSSMALAATTVVGAGAWQDFVAGNINQNGSPYWDQASLDGGDRNVGYFLTGTGGVFSTNYLGTGQQFWGGAYNSGTDTGGAADTSFSFTTTLPSSTSQFLLRITGYSGTDTIGFYDTTSGVKTQLFGPGDVVGATKTVTLTGSFGLYGLSGDGNTYYSQSGLNAVDPTQQHFALFQDKNYPGSFYAGFEDLSGNLGTEKYGDFNDLVIQFTPVPVPPSMLLLGSGLLGMGLLRFRRKNRA